MLTDVMTDYKKSSVIILKEVEKMSLMVEDILSSSKIESGAVKLHLESENLSEMIEECLMPLEGEIRKKNLDIRLGLNDFTINADSDKMCHALNNIIVNAIKYAKDYISIYNQKNILTIENDGCNLSDDELAHIFERFYTGRNGNTGIGLSLAKELIELHGWKLKAKKHDNQMFMTIEF